MHLNMVGVVTTWGEGDRGGIRLSPPLRKPLTSCWHPCLPDLIEPQLPPKAPFSKINKLPVWGLFVAQVNLGGEVHTKTAALYFQSQGSG